MIKNLRKSNGEVYKIYLPERSGLFCRDSDRNAIDNTNCNTVLTGDNNGKATTRSKQNQPKS